MDETPIGHDVPSDEHMTTEATRLEARRAIEAVVMVCDEPVDPRLLAQLLELSVELVEGLCQELRDEYLAASRGFELVRVAGGWRFQSHADLAPYVERFVLSGQSARLSSAALETLAIVAYKQPISRAQVASIRGVNVDGVMRTLHQRGYIAELARDPGPGQAVLFGTTSLFLERLGLDSLDGLAPLGDFVPGADVVEALETGLRVDPDETVPVDGTPAIETPAAVGTASPSDLGPRPEDSGIADDDEGIDLRERIVLDALDVLADDPPTR